MTAEIIVGIFMTACLGSLSFFLIRFISSHDEFEKKTGESIQGLQDKVKENHDYISYKIEVLEKDIRESALDRDMLRKLSKLPSDVSKLSRDLGKELQPAVLKIDNNYGRIMSLEKKLLSMFRSVEILVEKKRKRRQE